MDEIEPIFLVEAERLLKDGKVRESAELCTRGLVKYPQYLTAYLILVDALEALDDIVQMTEVIENAPNIIKYNQKVKNILEKHNIKLKQNTEENPTPKKKKANQPSEVITKDESNDDLETEINKAVRNDELNPDLVQTLTNESKLSQEQETEIKETLTLAKIYEQQDAYAEALAIYKQLQELLDDKTIYADKIIELETLLESQ